MFASVTEIETALRALVADFDNDVTSAQAIEEWKSLDQIARIAEAGKALRAPIVEESGRWRREGYPSAADYMAAVEGTTAADAREQIATGRRLAESPEVSDAARSGALSKRQARVVAEAAAAKPSAAKDLLETASRESLRVLTDECLRVKAAADADLEATHQRIHNSRSLSRGRRADGAYGLVGTGTVDEGAEIDFAIDAKADELFKKARTEGREVTREQLSWDALVEICRDAVGGRGAESSKPKQPPLRKLILLRVDLDALVRGAAGDGETCEIAGYGPTPASVIREGLGDGLMKLVLTRGVDVVNVVHLGRGVSVAQQVALLWSQPECIVLGCPRRARLENDHRNEWAKTKCTVLSDTDVYCDHHHDLKTYKGWKLVDGVGRRPMVPPDGAAPSSAA